MDRSLVSLRLAPRHGDSSHSGRHVCALFPLFVALLGCGGEPKAPEHPAPAPSSPVSVAPPAPSVSTRTPPPMAAPPPPAPELPTAAVVTFKGPFATPESVLYDADQDRYLVSNINGKPDGIDNNGFISELLPDGTIKSAKWIEGGKHGATLNAPKGMAIANGVLYVADVSTVRLFDAKTGAPKGEIKLPGATFANDVARSANGAKIYVSDSGLKLGEKGFEPTSADAVWVLEKGKASPLAKRPDLGRPNGLLADGDILNVVTFGTGAWYTLDGKGVSSKPQAFPKGSLDGIVNFKGKLYVSSWEGENIYETVPGSETFTVVVRGVRAPADIGLDEKRGRLLVPRFVSTRRAPS